MFYGQRLKNLREENNILQEDVANYLNVTFKAYSMYETEYKILPNKHLIPLCNYFDISIDYLFGFSNVKNYNNINTELDIKKAGLRLKEFRKDNNLTQTKLSSLLNTTHSVISGYESGRYYIATPFLYTICKKYNISADYLLGRIDNPKYLKNK